MPGQAARESPGFIAPMLATPSAGLPGDAAELEFAGRAGSGLSMAELPS